MVSPPFTGRRLLFTTPKIPGLSFDGKEAFQGWCPQQEKGSGVCRWQAPRPMYVDYKDLELLGKLTSRQGKLIGRRKSGCVAVSQRAVTQAVKRARFMALLPYVGD